MLNTDWKVCFLRAEVILLGQICALGKATLASSLHMKGIFFKHVYQILRDSLAPMTVCLRTEDLQRALHTFQSGVESKKSSELKF